MKEAMSDVLFPCTLEELNDQLGKQGISEDIISDILSRVEGQEEVEEDDFFELGEPYLDGEDLYEN
ncbi:MAG: hypothetical protein LBS94_01485 [Prevotellaceae bacterium]|jgi:hypothetical protein|nr:hypothetical protein [Prevotellaceae bacterium]